MKPDRDDRYLFSQGAIPLRALSSNHMFALQTSVASAAATNDPAIFAIALFVIAGGIAFGLLLGLPWIYVVAAAALFGIASGYVGTVVTFLVFVTLVRRNAVTIWAWLERHAEGADGNGRAGRFAAWGQRFRDRRRYGSRTRGEGRGKRSTRFGRKAQGSHQHGGHAGFGSGTHSGDGAYSGAAPYQAATRPAPEAVLGLAPGFNRR
ncbi:MAG: hypothetical protein AAFQ42_05585, partial [Pseudomonadota bacterium]